MNEFKTFRELIDFRRQFNRNDKGYTFLKGGEIENAEETLYGEFLDGAVQIGRALIEKGYQQKRVLLIYQPGLEFVEVFMGCLWAGVVAVPLYPPQNSRSLDRVSHVVKDCQPVAVIASDSLRDTLNQSSVFLINEDRLPIFTNQGLKDSSYNVQNLKNDPQPDWTAFIQYTSGSTSDPKGVVLSNQNILANQEMIAHCFDHSSDSVVVGWLPFYHDMGLIGNIMQPLFVGCPCILMPALYMMQKPIRWLRAISHYKATTSGGPDFGYDLCLKAIDETEMQGIDLSTWQVAFNGAEPIKASTLNNFTEVFKNWGFRSTTFLPCYGLAEASLIVSGVRPGDYQILFLDSESLSKDKVILRERSSSETIAVVSCGLPVLHTELRIVDPNSDRECAVDEIGEIWISGPSVSNGYLNKDDHNQKVFSQKVIHSGQELSTPTFFKTGDLGFIYEEKIFVTGRIKDVIIVGGKNHYPHDIEQSISENVDWLYNGTVAVYTIPSSENEAEGPGVLCELSRDMYRQVQKDENLARQLKQTLNRIVSENHHLAPREIHFTKPGGVPRTSSGKIKRNQCRLIAQELQTGLINWS